MVVDAWLKLSHDDSGERIFQIEDGAGKPRTVVLSKKQNGSVDLVEKTANSASVEEVLAFKAMHDHRGGAVIGSHRVGLRAPAKDKVLATVEADNVAVATAVINTAVKYVKGAIPIGNPGVRHIPRTNSQPKIPITHCT